MIWTPLCTTNIMGMNKLTDEEHLVKISIAEKYEVIKITGDEMLIDTDDYFVWVKTADGKISNEELNNNYNYDYDC